MEGKEELLINWSVPNFVNICIDERTDGELTGRLYHRYAKTDIVFDNTMQMVGQMEALFDAINYPQATSHMRSFLKEEKQVVLKEKLNPICSSQEAGQERGQQATFFVLVKSRANATWQGEVVWVERGMKKMFRSMMELLILMDNAIK